MAVTFDNNISAYSVLYGLIEVIRYDASANTHTSVIKAGTTPTATFDYFDDTATIGDWIGFSWNRGVWHDLVLYVGTAIAGTGITIAWEYSSYNSGGTLQWNTLTCTDGTAGFTNTGSQTVSFAPPDDWRYCTYSNFPGVSPSSYYNAGCYIRARITALTTITEGGANSTNTLDGKDYSIRVTGAETPATIYAADVAAGWGRVTKAGSHYYYIDANLTLGDGSTTSSLTWARYDCAQVGYCDVSSMEGPYNYYKKRTFIHTNTADSWLMGTLNGSGDGYYGGVFMYAPFLDYSPYNNWIAKSKLYSSRIQWMSPSSYNNAMFGGQATGGDLDLRFNQFVVGGTFYFNIIPTGTNPFYDNILELTSASSIYLYDQDLTINRLVFAYSAGLLCGQSSDFQNVNFGSTKLFTIGNSGITANAINCDFTGTLSSQITSGTPTSGYTNTNYLKFDVEFAVTDSKGTALSGFNVKIVDSAGTVIHNGAYSSAIRCTTYKASKAYGGSQTYTNYNPLEIWVWKDGYATYYEKISISNLNRKRAITLLHSPTEGRGSASSSIR